MTYKTDCYFYYEAQDMGARIPDCVKQKNFGCCPCTDDCENYITHREVHKLIESKLAERKIRNERPSEEH